MNIARLHEILALTTQSFRKGDVLQGTPELVAQAKNDDFDPGKAGGVLEIYAMPHVDEATDGIKTVDLEFLVIGVDKAAAEQYRAELVALLRDYPDPALLAEGPSYIHVGAALDDQGAALQLFALGEALGLWQVITPERLGFSGAAARQMAENGFLLITGFKG